jgi:hypothetical protein
VVIADLNADTGQHVPPTGGALPRNVTDEECSGWTGARRRSAQRGVVNPPVSCCEGLTKQDYALDAFAGVGSARGTQSSDWPRPS